MTVGALFFAIAAFACGMALLIIWQQKDSIKNGDYDNDSDELGL